MMGRLATMDWKLKLMQVLDCFGDMEGVWFQSDWDDYGISAAERQEIEAAYREYQAAKKAGEASDDGRS